MNTALKKKIVSSLTLTLFLCFNATLSGCSTAPALVASDFYTSLSPSPDNAETSGEIIDQLEHNHYAHPVIDDQLSSKMLDHYLADLDPGRSCFLEKDIMEFEAYRFNFDDNLKAGDLVPAFAIFNRYQQRLAERLIFMISHLEKGLQHIRFDVEENLETDRKNAPWPKNTHELDELWRKRLKSAVLNLTLADKSLDDAQKILLKRFRTQLNQTRQINSDDVFQTAINALTRSCDPHTEYFTPRVSENFNISMSLSLEGIGAVLQNENEYTKVVSLVPGGPADTARQLRPGDRIVGVGQGPDGEIVNVVGWRLDEVVQLIRGPKETTVRLEIIPATVDDEHQTKTIAIVRNTVKLENQAVQKKVLTLDRSGRKRKIGIIDIPSFYLDFKALQAHDADYKSTTHDVRRLLQELTSEHVDGLVIDLRDNGGGSLQEANLLTGMFIKQGPIVQVRDTNSTVTVMNDPDPEVLYKGPLVLLVNRLSASASEIVAAALQDYHRAIIMGEKTFGKGTVQALTPLQHGQLKITQAKFYRISGESTQQKGVAPDILYPGLYDMEKIGEDSLPQALPWDTIKPASYAAGPDLTQTIAKLHEHYAARVKTDPDYQYLLASVEHLKETREKTDLSLRETTRRQEDAESKQWRLELENKRRAAKHLQPLGKLSDLDSDNKTEGPGSTAPEDDPEIVEAGNILIDYIVLTAKEGAQDSQYSSRRMK